MLLMPTRPTTIATMHLAVRAARRLGCATLIALALPGVARAASAPKITTGPVIAGPAEVGAVLTASATWQGDPTPTAAWRWLRCTRASACTPIAGATSASYRIAEADLGLTLRVRLDVTNAQGSAS